MLKVSPNFVAVRALDFVLKRKGGFENGEVVGEYIETTKWFVNVDHILGIHIVDTQGGSKFNGKSVWQVILPDECGLIVSDEDAQRLLGVFNEED